MVRVAYSVGAPHVGAFADLEGLTWKKELQGNRFADIIGASCVAESPREKAYQMPLR